MVDIVKQLCIKSFTATSEETSFTLKQGKFYTTTLPDFTKDTLTVFSKYWLFNVPKENFVLKEK